MSIASTGYEPGDFVELSAIWDNERISVLLDDADLRRLSGLGIQTYTLSVPNSWQRSQVVMISDSDSTRGSEAYFLHSIELSGYRRELFIAQGDFNGNDQLDADDIDQLTLAIIQQSDDPRFNYGDDELDAGDRDF